MSEFTIIDETRDVTLTKFQPPTRDGWYWFRPEGRGHEQARIVEVRVACGKAKYRDPVLGAWLSADRGEFSPVAPPVFRTDTIAISTGRFTCSWIRTTRRAARDLAARCRRAGMDYVGVFRILQEGRRAWRVIARGRQDQIDAVVRKGAT